MDSINKKNYIECIRVMATLLVVIGHCAFYSISTGVTDMGYSAQSFLFDDSIVYKILQRITWLIYSCHMQLFFCLSGLVYSLCIRKKDKYSDMKKFVLNKSKRLLIPYVVISIIYIIPVYCMVGYFGNETCKNIVFFLLGYGKNHLWYLVTIFCAYIVVNMIRLYLDKKIMNVFFVISAILWLLTEFGVLRIIEAIYIDRIALYLFWFFVGYKIEEFIETYINKFNSRAHIIFAFMSGGLWIGTWSVDRLLKNINISILPEIFGVSFFITLGVCIADELKSLNECKLFSIIDRYSFDIYLYGAPVNYIIFFLLKILFGKIYLNNALSLLLFLTRLLLQLVVPIIISITIKKMEKILKLTFSKQ